MKNRISTILTLALAPAMALGMFITGVTHDAPTYADQTANGPAAVKPHNTPKWKPSDARDFPDCQPHRGGAPDFIPSMVVVVTLGNDRVLMTLDDASTHPAGTIWTVGVCR